MAPAVLKTVGSGEFTTVGICEGASSNPANRLVGVGIELGTSEGTSEGMSDPIGIGIEAGEGVSCRSSTGAGVGASLSGGRGRRVKRTRDFPSDVGNSRHTRTTSMYSSRSIIILRDSFRMNRRGSIVANCLNVKRMEENKCQQRPCLTCEWYRWRGGEKCRRVRLWTGVLQLR